MIPVYYIINLHIRVRMYQILLKTYAEHKGCLKKVPYYEQEQFVIGGSSVWWKGHFNSMGKYDRDLVAWDRPLGHNQEHWVIQIKIRLQLWPI